MVRKNKISDNKTKALVENNKRLYESIMRDVAKTVKKYLNEANTNININNINYDDFKDIIPDNDIIKEHRKFLVKFNNIRKKLLLNDYFLDKFLT
jgi:galactitol-specific phosphotransferase system IIB component